MSTNYAKTGSNSIRQTSTNGNGPRIRVNVKPGDDVDVTLYGLRSTNCLGTQHAGSVYVELYDCGTLVQSNNANLNNTYSNGQWHQLGVSYTVPTGGSEQQYIEVYTLVNTGQCESYFDDVEVDITQNTDIEEYYTAEILSRQFYYPYGSTVPHPNNLNANQYRYGFGGYVGDKQSKSYHSYYRSYDARLTRWKSTDPVVQPWQSPYTAYNNNPIRYVDPLGNVAKPRIRTLGGGGGGLGSFVNAMGGTIANGGSMALKGMPTLAFNSSLNNTNLFANSEANSTGGYFDNVGGELYASANGENGGDDWFTNFINTNPTLLYNKAFLNYTKKYLNSFDNVPGGKWDFWGEGSVPYTGKRLGGTNFVGAGPSGDPRASGLNYVDEIDATAYFHDVTYFINGAAGFKGARFNTDVAFADLQLVNAASSIMDRFYQGGIDQVTGFRISERTFKIASAIYIIFTPIVIDKYQRLGNFNPNIQQPYR